MEILMLWHGTPKLKEYTTPKDVATKLVFSLSTLSTSLFRFAKTQGRRFAKRNGKEVDLYEAEALCVLVDCAHNGESYTERKLREHIQRGLYKYMYADHVVAVSKQTVRNYKKKDKSALLMQPSIDEALGFTLYKYDRAIDFVDLLDEVCVTQLHRDYITLIMAGYSNEKISSECDIPLHLVNEIRAEIVAPIKMRM